MPDLQDQPTSPNASQSDGASDPLTGLFHMSTTAGVGTQDYVAINSVAVVCLFLGLASVLAFLSTIFLLLAVAGLVCGIIAIVQIRGSNRTQSGIGLASLGILLCLGIGGGRGAYQTIHRFHVSTDEREVADQMKKLGNLIGAEKYDEAYVLFDDRFKDRVTQTQFAAAFRNFGTDPASGLIRSIEWNNEPMNIEEQADAVYASGMAFFKFERDPAPRRSVVDFEKVDGQWHVHNIDAIFPVRRK